MGYCTIVVIAIALVACVLLLYFGGKGLAVGVSGEEADTTR